MTADEAAIYELTAPNATRALLLVCDHAGCAVPPEQPDLGVSPQDMRRHIAYDLGAAALTRSLAAHWGCRAILGRYTRLWVDLNRDPAQPSLAPLESDGTQVPANAQLSPVARAARIARYHEPYHAAIAAQLAALDRGGRPASLLAIHSFTPVLAGRSRPWQIGVLWDRDERVARPLLERLRRIEGLVVGDNEPYSGRHPADYTVHRHAVASGRRHCCIELRQDEIDSPAAIERWAALLTRTLEDLL